MTPVARRPVWRRCWRTPSRRSTAQSADPSRRSRCVLVTPTGPPGRASGAARRCFLARERSDVGGSASLGVNGVYTERQSRHAALTATSWATASLKSGAPVSRGGAVVRTPDRSHWRGRGRQSRTLREVRVASYANRPSGELLSVEPVSQRCCFGTAGRAGTPLSRSGQGCRGCKRRLRRPIRTGPLLFLSAKGPPGARPRWTTSCRRPDSPPRERSGSAGCELPTLCQRPTPRTRLK